MPDAVVPRPEPPVGSPYATLWLDMMNQGAALCVDAWRQWGDLFAASAVAQAKAASNLCLYATATEGMGTSPLAPASKEMVMMIEGQAERFADAWRETIHDLEASRPPGAPPH